MAGDRTRRRWLALGLLVAVSVIAIAALWPGASGPPRSSSEGSEPPSSAAPAPAPVAAAPPGAPPPGGGAPPRDPIAAYREQTRYAPGSGRLASEAVDLLEPNRRYETPLPIRASLEGGGEPVTHLFEADRYYYSGDEVVRASLRVRQGAAVVPVSIRSAVAVAESATGPVGDELELTFRIDGEDPAAEIDLEVDFPEHHGTIQIVVLFQWAPGEVEEATLRFFTTPAGGIPAVFTGRDLDTVEAGSLVVELGVEVKRAGFYRIDANLFSQTGDPLAYGAFKGELAAGTRSVPVRFFGLLLHDLGVPGPYEVRNIRGYLFREAEHPDRLRMRDATHTHWTRSYALSAFSEDEYASEHKTRMLELLEADVAAGLIVDVPEAASAASPDGAAPGDE